MDIPLYKELVVFNQHWPFAIQHPHQRIPFEVQGHRAGMDII